MTGEQIQAILPDIPRLYTALAEWLACLLCIMEIKRRLSGWKLAAVSAGMLVAQSIFLEMTGKMKDVRWMVCMAAAVGMMYLFLFLCCDTNAKAVGYYCARAFVVAECAASLEWQLECFACFELQWQGIWFRGICLVVTYSLVYVLIWALYHSHIKGQEELQVMDRELLSCVIIGLAVFLASNMGFISFNTPFTSKYMEEVFRARTLIDVGGVAILYAYHVQRMDLRVRHELESVQNILHNQYIQYQQSQEAMDIINYKYHDLKHHILALRAEENAQKRDAYLDKMEEEIYNYEAQNKTGNEVLDILLTSKNLFCMKNDISMTSVVDGTLFEFMDVMDLCSIFGNALDNAIEYEKKIQEKEKRLIHVSAFLQKNFLMIRFENYCEESLVFDKDFPVTTKEDARFHGYGLKSLQYTVKKYGGVIDMDTQDNWFHLRILIPMNMENIP